MRRSGIVVTTVAGLMLAAGCGGSGGAPAGTTRATVGELTVHYPDGWALLGDGDKPAGWDWAAQDEAGTAGTTQLAVDGDYTAQGVDIAVAELLAAAQVGSYPGFALQGQRPVEVDGADRATRVDFTYTVDGTDFQAVWVVARGTGEKTAVAQLSGRKPLDPDLTETVVDGMASK